MSFYLQQQIKLINSKLPREDNNIIKLKGKIQISDYENKNIIL